MDRWSVSGSSSVYFIFITYSSRMFKSRKVSLCVFHLKKEMENVCPFLDVLV